MTKPLHAALARLLGAALLGAPACNTQPPTGAGPWGASTVEPSPAASHATAAAPRGRVGVSVADIAGSKGVGPIMASGGARPGVDTLPLVTVTRTELLVGDAHVADVPPGALGFDATLKRAGKQAALELLPLEAALRPVHDADPSQTTLRLLFDASTAYRAALEVMFSASQAGFTSFELVVKANGDWAAVPASTPSRAERQAAHAAGAVPPASFLLQADGASLSVGDVVIGPGCTKGGHGAAVPAVAGKLDEGAIGACAARLRGMDPSWASGTVANVSVAPGLDMQSVVAAVARIVPVFPVVHFGMISG